MPARCCPTLQVHPAEPAADARLLKDLAAWCERYTPQVALDRSAAHEPGGALWLDVTGCAHLFGGEAALRADLLARLGRQGLAADGGDRRRPRRRLGGRALRRARAPDRAAGRRQRRARPLAGRRAAPRARAQRDARAPRPRPDRATSIPCRAPALTARFGAALVTRLDQALRPARRADLAAPPSAGPSRPAAARRAAPRGRGARGPDPAAARSALRRPGGGRSRRAPAHARVLPGRQQHRLRRDRHQPAVPRAPPARPPVRREAGADRPRLRHRAGDPRGRGGRALAARAARLAQHGRGRPRSGARSGTSGRPPEQPAGRGRGQPAGAGREPSARARPAPRPGARSGKAGRVRPRASCTGRRRRGPCACSPGPSRSRRSPPLPDEPPVLFRWRQAVHRVARARGPERLAPEWWRAARRRPRRF